MSSGRAMAPIFLATWSLRSSLSSAVGLVAFLERDERRQGLALEVVVFADHRRLGHGRVVHQRALHLHGADPVAGDVEHVVHPSEDPPVAVVVELGAVAGEVLVAELGPVGLR